jgi:hypothetical protein
VLCSESDFRISSTADSMNFRFALLDGIGVPSKFSLLSEIHDWHRLRPPIFQLPAPFQVKKFLLSFIHQH